MRRVFIFIFYIFLLSGCSEIREIGNNDWVKDMVASESQSDTEKLQAVRKLLAESDGSWGILSPNTETQFSNQELDMLEKLPDAQVDALIDSLFQNIE